jgi:DNA topoisomerase-1
MGKALVIVESPAKAKTINRFLGRNYLVKASMGHVRDLPKGSLGIDIENGFNPKYQTIRGRGKTISALKKVAGDAEKVYLAPDPDREGEAIAWHLMEALKLKPERVFRVTFNEITRNAVGEAFEQPGKICMDRVNAQQARRMLDRIVGYKLSPLLWKKIAKGLSAGRVQSVAVRLIAEREREIVAFEHEEFWKISARLRSPEGGDAFKAELWKAAGSSVKIPNQAAADGLLERLNEHPFVIQSIQKSKKTDRAMPPFSTSILQQQASIRLRFSARKTMLIAQQLYEGVEIGGEGSVGLITYMRTDSFRIAGEALDECRAYISDHFSPAYLPEKPNSFPSRKGAQAAHEAIRPTGVQRTPESLKPHLTTDQYKLYRLIWERFVASQMMPARYDLTNVTIQAGDLSFLAKGKVMVFDGHTRVLRPYREREDQVLPVLEEGITLIKESVDKTQHFTQPPPRYTEATLVKALEKKGIGRPSTYASIISTIQDRGYVRLQERKFFATELGDMVTTQLVSSFPKLIDTEFTSGMEEKLDDIADGRMEWLDVLKDFYSFFSADLEVAYDKMMDIKSKPESAGMDCDKCGKPMIYRFNKRGRFIACSGYPDCKNTLSVSQSGEPKKEEPIPTDEVCEKCSAPMVIRSGRRGRFMACSAFPKCRNTISVDENLKPVRPEDAGMACEKCGARMVVRYGRRGRFVACSAFPKCRNTKPLPPSMKIEEPEETDQTCPECGRKLLIRNGRRGKFMACSGFPECAYTASLNRVPDPQPV